MSFFKHFFISNLQKIVFVSLVVSLSALHAQNYVVNTKGTMGVSQGAFSYNVDIEVPPGIAGVAPKLSLSYNSGSGNGLLGLGWSLNGMSFISRCGSTVADDGKYRAVRLDDNDNYCMDGQRLISVSENEYRTKMESYSKIVHDPVTDSFTVWTKSGDIYEYGTATDAKFLHYETDETVVWKIKKIKDTLATHNNAIVFEYEENAQILKSISYAEGANKVVFEYDDKRLDVTKQNLKGQIIESKKNLSRIAIYVNDTPLRSYELDYLAQSSTRDPLKLESIKECTIKESTECLEPLVFEWQKNDEAEPVFTKSDTRPMGSTTKSYEMMVADFNNDGYSDVLRANDGNLQIYLFNPETHKLKWTFNKEIAFFNYENLDNVKLVDLNNDGLVDIYYASFSSKFASILYGGAYVFLNDGDGTFTTSILETQNDYAYATSTFVFNLSQDQNITYSSSAKNTVFVDIDQDGDMDMYQIGEVNMHNLLETPFFEDTIWINDGTGSFELASKVPFEYNSDCYKLDMKARDKKKNNMVAFFDYDGDGSLDMLMLNPVLKEKTITPSDSLFSTFNLTASTLTHILKYEVNLYLNDGSQHFTLAQTDITNAEGTYVSPLSDLPNFYHEYTELNGDGIPDIVHIENGEHYKTDENDIYRSYVALSNAQGGWDKHILPINSYKKHIRMLDINGDGALDIYRIIKNFANEYWLNDGKGAFVKHKSIYRNRPVFPFIFNNDKHKNRFDFLDINGDGFIDVIDKANALYQQPEAGDYFATDKVGNILLNDLILDYEPVETVEFSFTSDEEHYNAIYGDFNADGMTDIWDTVKGLYLNNRKKEMIVAITDGFKNRTEIEYAPLNDAAVYSKGNSDEKNIVDQRPPGIAVHKVSTTDGIGGEHVQTYTYSGYRSHILRGSLGFATVSVKDEVTGVTTYMEYNQTYPFAGTVSYTKSYMLGEGSGDWLLSESRAQNKIFEWQDGSWKEIDPKDIPYPGNGARYKVLKYSDMTKSYVDGELLKTVTNEYAITDEYKNYGNVEVIISTTTGDGQTFTKKTASTYERREGNNWVWSQGRLQTVEVEHTSTTGAPVTKSSSFTYYDNGMLKSETIEPNESNALTTTYVYDDYGNKINETLSSPSFTEDRVTRYVYDDKGQFITDVYNALNHHESRVYDPNTGNLLQLTGPNNLTTSWIYNDWGQKVRENRADGTYTVWEYEYDDSYVKRYDNITHNINTQSHYTITQYDSDPSGIERGKSAVYHDRLNRTVASQALGFDDEKIWIETAYNAKGEVDKKSAPYKTGESPEYIDYTYDDYGRITKTETPAPNGGTITSTVEYDGFKTTALDGRGQLKMVKKDALDRIVLSREGKDTAAEAEKSYTVYGYDAAGNLKWTKANNSDAHKITMKYDIFGNKIEMSDPDMGTWYYTYDATGKLLTQTDNNGSVTTLTYDVLGRLRTKISPDGQFIWRYDDKPNAIGKLTVEKSVKNGNAEFLKHYYYDDLSRVQRTETTIDGTTYKEKYFYNDKGQLDSTIKPDGFTLVNVYKDNGYLEAIKSPKWKIPDFDRAHYESLITQALHDAESYYHEYLRLKDEAAALKIQADYYEEVASLNQDQYEQLMADAAQLRENAAEFEALALIYRSYAQKAESQAEWYETIAQFSNDSDLYASLAIHYEHLVAEYNATAAEYEQKALIALEDANTTESDAQTKLEYAELYLQLYQDILVQLEAKEEDMQRNKTLAGEGGGDISYAYQQTLNDTGYVYHYKVLEMDSHGRVTKYLSGNGLINTDAYDQSGVMLSSHTGYHEGDSTIRDLSYAYDDAYNVSRRTDHKLGIASEYTYDSLNRVKTATFTGNTVNGLSDMSYEYDIYGNITYKSDQGTYIYDENHANRLKQIEDADGNILKTFTYDANGNMLKNHDIDLEYNAANLTTKIVENGTTIYFHYDMNGNRYKKVQDGRTTHYVGKSYEQIEELDGTIRQRHFVYANGRVLAINTDTYNPNDELASSEIIYMHYDSLGSVDTITNNKGQVKERRIFKPFGEQIVVEGEVDDGRLGTNRGYTGHEHIEGTRLIHMNARIYDPTLGRFLSADPIIQDPHDTMAYNRYSYARNNPLKYTDPSGNCIFAEIIALVINIVIAAVVTIGTYGLVTAAVLSLKPVREFIADNQWLQILVSIVALRTDLLLGVLWSGYTTSVNGGGTFDVLMSMFTTFVSAKVSFDIGEQFGHPTSFFKGDFTEALKKAVAHGILRGTMAVFQRGSFGAGFASGFVNSGFSIGVRDGQGTLETITRASASALIGGTVSQLTGGKFANGAQGAAIQYLYNDIADKIAFGNRGDSRLLADYVAPTAETAVEFWAVFKIYRGLRWGINGFRSAIFGYGLKNVDDIINNPKRIWGSSADDIVKVLNQDGIKATIRPSTQGSKKSIQIDIHKHSQLTKIQVHPGGGRHVGAYYKVSTSTQGIFKVVDRNTYIPTADDKATIIYK